MTISEIRAMAIRLYSLMPNAQPVPRDEFGQEYWGEIDHTREWSFCEQIAREIAAAVKAAKTARKGEG